MTMYRQGDLLFIETIDIPESKGAILKHGDDKLVVLGSTITGHDHAIRDGRVYLHIPKWRNNANFYVEGNHKTCKSAIAWTFGLSESEYKPLIES